MAAAAEKAIGIAALALAGVMAFGAAQIPSAAGYAGVGPNFLPWAVTTAQARTPSNCSRLATRPASSVP